ncbi:MAG: bifunctional hydroxymethylpyrimidine kinase/phosphomethylpyrimidine kinase [Lachnospiraceae bacterium]|nr:bifunctional hydroxymethylpyrimidine kinase/phosphomethylpyrimidine kinase [Candidatus Merdinaster equi]
MYTALTIAGSDSSAGAGIQADIKTMTSLGVYGMSAITALTAQNTTGVKSIREVDTDFLKDQLDCVFDDIYPDAVKTGMLANAAIISTVADSLKEHKVQKLVIDPVMVSTSGSKLIADDAIETLKTKLLPLQGLVTPNIPEAEVLSGMAIKNDLDVEKAATIIYEAYGASVLLKGGHGVSTADDYLYTGKTARWYRGERIDNPNTHGTGCTLSSAITSYLAMGLCVEEAIQKAKEYLTGAIRAGLNLGRGSGPLNHMFNIHVDGKSS